MFVVVAAGGTGGHFYPGLAVARELMAEGHEIAFMIKKGDYVRPLLEREKIPYVAISAGGFRRTLDPRHVFVVFKLILGYFEALRYFLIHRPRVLLVMGGYLSVPPALAARLLFIPVVLHEQNVKPGLANRFLSFLSSEVAVSFSASVPVFGHDAVLTGNPVRKEFTQLPSQSEARKKWKLDPSKKTILIFGGSLGAHKLNELVLDALAGLASYANSFQFIHITGMADVTWVRQRYEKMAFQHYVDSFCHDMPAAYAASDLVFSRAGASTVAELMVVKKPAIFVPYPLATGDHQTANAEVMVKVGAAVIHQQRDLEGGRLKTILEDLLKNPAGWPAWKGELKDAEVDPTVSAGKIALLVRKVAS